MVHVALQLGLFRDACWGMESLSLSAQIRAQKEGAKTSMQKDELARLRRLTKNNLHLSIIILSDFMTKILLCLILECVKPLLQWYLSLIHI